MDRSYIVRIGAEKGYFSALLIILIKNQYGTIRVENGKLESDFYEFLSTEY